MKLFCIAILLNIFLSIFPSLRSFAKEDIRYIEYHHTESVVTDTEGIPDNVSKLPEAQQQEIDVVLRKNDVSCTSLGSASIDVVSSCTGNPTITWSNGHVGNNVINLNPGNYSVTVSDGDGCADKILNFSIADVEFGIYFLTEGSLCTGAVTISAGITGANPSSVNYLWNTTPPQTTSSISVTSVGTYTVTATLGTCSETKTISINVGDFFEIVHTPYICQGRIGTALVNIVGMSPERIFLYEWSPNGEITPGINITTPGVYSVTVTDVQSGCSASKSVNVENAPLINLRIDSQDISCYGAADGQATAVPSGGMGDFTYEWSIMFTSQTIGNLISGNYAVTVTDSIGCTASSTVFIDEPPRFSYETSPEEQGICYGGQATISVIAEGGVEPYHYYWHDVPGLDLPNRPVSPTETTVYTVEVTDNNGCTANPQTTTVKVSQPIDINVRTVDVACHGECTGAAALDITGGLGRFEFSWDSNNDFIEELCAGDYSVTVTDQYGCSASANFSIEQPDTFMIRMYSGDATCYGYDDGYVMVEGIGGVRFDNGDYRYRWSSGHQVDSVNVYAGTYRVTVTDANGCIRTDSVVVEQPEAVYVTDPYPAGGVICTGETFSTVVHATGGRGPYTFVWHGSDGSTWHGATLSVSPVQTTTYTLSVTDVNGCPGPSKAVTVVINPPVSILEITSSAHEICIGDQVAVNMNITGGNGGPYNIFFQDNELINTPFIFRPQETGYYRFGVTDDCNSPGDKDSIYVIVHPLPDLGFHSDRTTSCPNGEFNFTEVMPSIGQTYLWNFGDGGISVLKNPSHVYRDPGFYTVSLTVTSVEGCQSSYAFENMIEIYPNPRAEFLADPDFVSILNANIIFHNYSVNGSTYYWDFGDGDVNIWSADQRVAHLYEDVGDYTVMLVAKSEKECVDTIYKKVRVHDEFTFYAPTAFTPNGDSSNDLFYVLGHGINKDQFHLTIHDRYGNRVFQSNVFDEENPINMAWDGTNRESPSDGGKPLGNGVYIWRCSFVDFTGKSHEKSGTVTLIR